MVRAWEMLGLADGYLTDDFRWFFQDKILFINGMWWVNDHRVRQRGNVGSCWWIPGRNPLRDQINEMSRRFFCVEQINIYYHILFPCLQPDQYTTISKYCTNSNSVFDSNRHNIIFLNLKTIKRISSKTSAKKMTVKNNVI